MMETKDILETFNRYENNFGKISDNFTSIQDCFDKVASDMSSCESRIKLLENRISCVENGDSGLGLVIFGVVLGVVGACIFEQKRKKQKINENLDE